MSEKTSKLSGGGYRHTQYYGGNVRTTDYNRYGKRVGSTQTDRNGNVYNRDSTGRTTHKIGNDGRYKR